MRRKDLIAVFLLGCMCMAAMSVWAAAEGPDKDYVIGPGDVIDISVRQDVKLTKSVAVLPDGKISLPLVGQIIAGGKTVEQLKKDLAREIAVFVPDPVLTVGVSHVNSMLIYVIGKVNEPGRYVLNSNVKVLQGLAIAGGFNTFADENKVKIIREERGSTKILEFRYDDMAKGKNLEQNIWLKRGDVILVP